MVVSTHGLQLQPRWNDRLFSSFASIYRMKFIPEVRLDSFEALGTLSPRALAEEAKSIKADGILLNMGAIMRGMILSQLTSWLQDASQVLAASGLTMLVQLPPVLEQPSTLPSVIQALPEAQVVTTEDATVAVAVEASATNPPVVLKEETAPLPYRDLELTLYYELSGLTQPDETWSTEMHAEWLRQEGRAAFRVGDFQKAREIWTHWKEIEPSNEEPVSLIGDVFLREGDIGKAMDFYRQSLDLNPGQIGLVIRMSRILDVNAKKPEEAMQLLNRYARIFPNHPDIALAQAEWLIRQRRDEEATALVRKVVELFPENLRARTMLHPLLKDPRKQYENLKKIVEVGSQTGLEQQLARAIQEQDLFTLPESWMLMEFLERMSVKAPEEQRELYTSLLPRDRKAYDDFRSGRLSSEWISSVNYEEDQAGAMLLAADPSKTEAYLRLVRSDSMLNGFVEALVEEPRGYLWLYARRGAGSMVRFGFDQSGQLYLQVWRGGQIIARSTRYWVKPDRPIRLRLELRGDGALGFVDGEAAFTAPLAIPRSMGLGWWGLAPWAPQFGQAQVLIREVSGGPLPVQIGWFQSRGESLTDEQILARLKPHIQQISAVSPPWFAHASDGTVEKRGEGDFPDVRIFSRYHQARLLPAIQDVSLRTLDVAQLVPLAETNRVDGFTLLVPRMPPEDWFERAEKDLLGTSLTLLVAHLDLDKKTAELREVAPYVGLFPGARATHTLPMIEPEATPPDAPPKPQDENQESAVLIL
ncbi:MAG TPA: tetratricopeptide repeat protein [Kiritimatiellia bacterium]|nr:tetratricopeptide repeat protein [Kiritimatiellia bacterium]HSA18011.1 tetratricopeptide repeat protein [Kiritimatiellia bacterium]